MGVCKISRSGKLDVESKTVKEAPIVQGFMHPATILSQTYHYKETACTIHDVRVMQ
jgi:hypothetical protein